MKTTYVIPPTTAPIRQVVNGPETIDLKPGLLALGDHHAARPGQRRLALSSSAGCGSGDHCRALRS